MRAALTNIFIIIAGVMIIAPDAFAFESADGQRSVVKSLGQLSDFEKVGSVFLPNRNAWGQVGKQGDVSYRMLKGKAEADIFISPVDFDDKGLPKNNMVLEILYQDRVWQKKNNKSATDERVRIKFRTDFSKDNQYEEAGYLKAEGDDKWKLAQIFCEQTPRQMMRVIDGSFQIKIVMPRRGSREVPVSYIRLISMDQQEFLGLREEERSRRGLIRVEYTPEQKKVAPSDKWKKLGFAVYQVNCLELQFPNSIVDYEQAGLPLKCFEIPGQIEPISFVVHALKEMSAVNVKVSDLHFEKNTISASMVDIRRVCFNDQRWGWSWAKKYGKCPDYLSFSDPEVDISRDSNCQFWLTITIPEETPAGSYEGKVTVYTKDKELYTMELCVEVLPVRLLKDRVKHMIYHSPYWVKLHRDPLRVFYDMKKHGMVPIFRPPIGLAKSKTELVGELNDFDHQLQSFRKVYPEAGELFITLLNPRAVWRGLKGPKPEFTRSFLKFEETYGRILKQCADLGEFYGLEIYFGFADEPFKDFYKRRLVYLCSRIAQSKGLKTWSSHNLNYDVQLEVSQLERRSNTNYLRPLREVLDVFVEHIGRIDFNTIRVLGGDQAKLACGTTYLCTSIRPMYNRFVHGIYPFVLKNRFVLSYAYRDSILDPYDDMDTRTSHLKVVGMNDYLLSYPTWQGDILPTLSYESLREGVEDSHIISTLQILTDKALQSDNPEILKLGKDARNYLDSIETRISKSFRGKYYKAPRELLVDPTEKAILEDLNGVHDEGYDIFNIIRRDICDRIIALQNAFGR
jgi:Glycoside hydrolase 123 N-terminal domain